MLCNPISYYPDKIDEMIFFQDNNLEKTDLINTYNNLVTQGNYSKANDFIHQQEGIYGFWADFFNLIENRIYNLQEYLLQKPPKKQPFVSSEEDESTGDLPNITDEEKEPSVITGDTIWI